MKKYSSLKDWKKDNPKEYNKAKNIGFIDIISKEMGWEKELPSYWTYNKCLEEALKCGSKTKWYDLHRVSFNIARKNGWLSEIDSILKPLIAKRLSQLYKKKKKDNSNYDYNKFLDLVDKLQYNFSTLHEYRQFILTLGLINPDYNKLLPHNPKQEFPSRGKTNSDIFKGKLESNNFMVLDRNGCVTYALEHNLFTEEQWVTHYKKYGIDFNKEGLKVIPYNPYEHYGLRELNISLFPGINGLIVKINFIEVPNEPYKLYGFKTTEGKHYFRYVHEYNKEINYIMDGKKFFQMDSFTGSSMAMPNRIIFGNGTTDELGFINDFCGKIHRELTGGFVKEVKKIILKETYTNQLNKKMHIRLDEDNQIWIHHENLNFKFQKINDFKYKLSKDEEFILSSFSDRSEYIKFKVIIN
tara:strand:+ start:3123 stop:4358 length:1236 start_codon:yes stop_codon:yes gene_type:complete